MSQTPDNRYKKALQVCIDRLVNEESSEPFAVAVRFFRMGVVLGRLGEVGESIRCFNNAFVMRDAAFEKQTQKGWREFHDMQMATYILGKKNKYIASLAEGDMIHDLIKQRWIQLQVEMERSEIPFKGKNLPAWFRTVRVDFPWDMEDVESIFLDQKTLYDQDKLLECVKITQ